jgi:hypothetical protein
MLFLVYEDQGVMSSDPIFSISFPYCSLIHSPRPRVSDRATHDASPPPPHQASTPSSRGACRRSPHPLPRPKIKLSLVCSWLHIFFINSGRALPPPTAPRSALAAQCRLRHH